MAGLTVAVLMFLLLIYVPGNVALYIAGRRRAERSLLNVLVIGSGVFAMVFLVMGLLQVTGRSDVFVRFVSAVATASGIAQAKPEHFLPLLWIFAAEYSIAAFVGLVELFQVAGAPCRRQALSLKSENLLLELLIKYRRAGLRPFITVYMNQGDKISGECLRYGWNGKMSFLIRDADNPEKRTWVSLEDVLKIEFVNRGFVEIAEKDKEHEAALVQKLESLRKVFNWMADGYGDEVYGEKIRNAKKA